MAKLPFTPSGVEQKFHEIYALPQTEINAHAGRIATDLPGWMSAEFTLNQKEIQYIASIEPEYIGFLQGELSEAVKSKLPIHLDPPYPPVENDGSKRIKLSKTVQRYYHNGQILPATGGVNIAIDYLIG